jgi:tripartite-type tricarboxylate transporter receptor subunit TctC
VHGNVHWETAGNQGVLSLDAVVEEGAAMSYSIGSLAAFALTTALLAQPCPAQNYPSKPVRLIVPFPAGAGVDAGGRVLAQKLSDIWGQQVIVDNRPGAAANIGAEITAHSAPDGHTMLLTNNALTISAGLYPRLSYNALTDLRPVTQVLTAFFILLVPSTSPARTVKELVALAKSKPGELAYASAGIGSGPHLAAVLFASMTGISINHVPYKGAGLVLPDLIAGRVQMFLTTPLTAMPHVRAGRIRALGVTTAKRSPALPDIPTISESGVPGYEVTTWFMLLVTAKTSNAIVEKIHKDAVSLLGQADVIKALTGDGAEIVGSTPEQATALLKHEIVLWTKVIKEAGVTAAD